MSTNEALFLSDNGFSHHAFGVEGNPAVTVAWLQAQLGLGADLSVYANEQCDIDTVRTVRARADERGFTGKRAFIISGYRFTDPAQNALLKITEEPVEGTAFFLVVPHISHFLPTLRSRLRHILAPSARTFKEEVQAFLKAPLPERLMLMEKMLEGQDVHGEKRIVAERLDRFTQELARALHAKRRAGEMSPAEREILFVRDYLYDTASSLRMLGEHLAISVGLC